MQCIYSALMQFKRFTDCSIREYLSISETFTYYASIIYYYAGIFDAGLESVYQSVKSFDHIVSYV